ncbi:hypothetical protein IU448_08220 [Nocardia flavorosea]|uniref:hypothetical protein n=1 Tax=Nocardia flavorosea TaxID=53429 RepID=UPI001892F31B|nr:hypothetical protein [Nocardia flavorosea]MBF6349005.1 hypothetical protein [Nocardia flavorosea]
MFRRLISRIKKGSTMSGTDYFNGDENARYQAIFDQLNADIRTRRAAREADPNRETLADIDPETLQKLRDRANDMVTPETEGWHQDADHWYDGAGNIVYTRGPDGWYDNNGTRIYDLMYKRISNPQPRGPQ